MHLLMSLLGILNHLWMQVLANQPWTWQWWAIWLVVPELVYSFLAFTSMDCAVVLVFSQSQSLKVLVLCTWGPPRLSLCGCGHRRSKLAWINTHHCHFSGQMSSSLTHFSGLFSNITVSDTKCPATRSLVHSALIQWWCLSGRSAFDDEMMRNTLPSSKKHVISVYRKHIPQSKPWGNDALISWSCKYGSCFVSISFHWMFNWLGL